MEEHLAGADGRGRALDLYRRFVAVVEAGGPFDFAPTQRQLGAAMRAVSLSEIRAARALWLRRSGPASGRRAEAAA